MSLSGFSWRPSKRLGLGTAGVVDLLARAPTDILAPLVSLTGGAVNQPLIGTFTTWVLVFAVFYWFAPLVFSLVGELEQNCEQPAFKGIFAAGGVSWGLIFNRVVPIEFWYVVFSLCWGVIFLGHLLSVQNREILDPDGLGGALLYTFSWSSDGRNELKTDLDREGITRSLVPPIYAIGFISFFTLPLALAGVLSTVFVAAYPIPDILVLGWALGAVLFDRIPLGPSKSKVANSKFDIERFTMDALEDGLRSVAGLFLLFMILTGMLLAASYTKIVVQGLNNSIELIFSTAELLWQVNTLESTATESYDSIEISVNLWNHIISPLGLFTVSGFALWGWVRELKRLPHFLDYWEDRNMASGVPPARPRGFMLLPSLGAGLYAVYLNIALPNPVSASGIEYGLATGWVVIIAALVWVAVQSYSPTSKRNQSVEYEHYWITSGVIVLWLPLSLATGGEAINEIFTVITIVMLILGMVIAGKYAKSADNAWSYVDAAYLCLSGLFVVGSHSYWTARYREKGYVLGVVMIIGGIALAIVRLFLD